MKTFFFFFFGEHLRLCPWSLALASSIPVLGLESVCPRKGCSWPWPRIFFVSLALASSLVSSTPPLVIISQLRCFLTFAGQSFNILIVLRASGLKASSSEAFERATRTEKLSSHRNRTCSLWITGPLLYHLSKRRRLLACLILAI